MAGSDAGGPEGSGYLQVQTTTDSRAEAMELARAAVEARLAACGQVAGPCASTYWWNDELERAEEWFVFLKTPADRYAELAAFLTQRHSYDEPEIVATRIVAGSASFLNWVREETRPRPANGATADPDPASAVAEQPPQPAAAQPAAAEPEAAEPEAAEPEAAQPAAAEPEIGAG